MDYSKKTTIYLSEDIFLAIIKNMEKEIENYLLKPVNRIYSYVALKNLYNSNKNFQYLFKHIELVLSGSNLCNVELSNKNLSNIRFSHANMNRAILKKCNLSNANLEYTDLQYADLSGANLTNANLIGANLTGAILDKTNFTNTQTEDIIIDETNLQTIYFNSSL